MLLRLIEPDGGELRFEGRDLLALRGEELRSQRRQMQMIFQDPFASLNSRMCVGEIVAEPLAIHEPGLSVAHRRDARRPIPGSRPCRTSPPRPKNDYTRELLSAVPELPGA
jgi:ABC-type microcin C transport system duplicated ATPase subunit YejF